MKGSPRPRSTIWSYRSLIWNFARRDLKSRFKGTTIGWAWSLLFPLATLLTYSLVFSVIFKSTPPNFGDGTPGFYPIWLFTGLVPWSFFLISINIAMPTLLANGPLLQKVYFPSYAPILGSVLAILVQTVIELSIVGASLAIVRNVALTWLLVPIWLMAFVTFVAGVSVTLAILNVYLRDLAHLTNVILGLLFFLTPIIYQVTLVPEVLHGIPLRTLVRLNPISLFVESLRNLVYDLRLPSPLVWLGIGGWAIAAAAVAMLVYRRRGLDIGEAI